MVHVWEIGEVHAGFFGGDLSEREHWPDLDVDGRIILKRIFRKWNGSVD